MSAPTVALNWLSAISKTRGPGEFLGTRQAGFASTLRMASITDVALIEKARTQAQELFERDPIFTNLNMPCLPKPLTASGVKVKGMYSALCVTSRSQDSPSARRPFALRG